MRSKGSGWRAGKRLFAVATVAGCLILSGCARTPQQKAAKLIAHAKTQFDKQDYASALLDLRSAAHLVPKDPEPLYQLSLVYLATGEVQTAVNALLYATKLNPGHAAAQLKLAELMSASQDPTVLVDAAERARSIVTLAPENADALSTLAVVEYELGHPQDAEADLDAALAKAPENLKAARALAMLKFKNNEFSGAEAILKKAVDQAPKSAEAEWSLGQLYLMAKRNQDAEAAFRRAVAIDPKYVSGLLNLLGLELAAGRKDQAEQTLKLISGLPDPQYRSWHAMFLFDQVNQDAGLAELDKLVKDDPKDRALRGRLIETYMLAKRFPQAEQTIAAALRKNDKDVDALLARSKLYLLTARITEAQADLTEVLRAKPDSADAHFLLSKAHEARGHELERRQELGLALNLDPGATGARVELAQSLILAKSPRSALDLLQRTPDSVRNALPVIIARNRALFALEDWAALRKSIDEGIAIRRLPELVLQDGYLKLRRRDVAGARKSFQEVLSNTADDPRPLDALAQTYLAEKKDAMALQLVRDYATRRPNSAHIQFLLGVWLARAKQPGEAKKAFAAAVAADPAMAPARIQLAEMDILAGNLISAQETLAAVATTPIGRAPAELVLGMLEDSKPARDPAAAITHYRKVLEVDPNNLLALNNLAYHLGNGNDTYQLNEALKYAQQAADQAPDNPSISDTAGWVYYQNGFFPSAIKLLEKSIAQEPTAQRKYHLAMAYCKAGKQARARQMLEQANKMDPNLPEAAMAQQLIASTGSALKQ